MLTDAVDLARSATSRSSSYLFLEQLAQTLDDTADQLVAAKDAAATTVRAEALWAARTAASRAPAARSTLAQVLNSAAIQHLNVSECIDAIPYLVELLELDLDQDKVVSVVYMLVSSLTTASQNPADDAERAACRDRLLEAVATSVRWEPQFAAYDTDNPSAGKHPLLLSTTATALAYLDRHDEAVALAERALRLVPPQAPPAILEQAYQALAVALYRAQRDTDRAIGLCEASLAILSTLLDEHPAFRDEAHDTAALYAKLLDRAERVDEARQVRAVVGLE